MLVFKINVNVSAHGRVAVAKYKPRAKPLDVTAVRAPTKPTAKLIPIGPGAFRRSKVG